nr:ABC transporter substrate-binding protein [Rhabdothermincola salaria]
MLHARLTSTTPGAVEPEPALAEAWEVSDDATTFTFRLRAEARFSDGSPVTAADVVASLTRVAALGPASLASARLDAVAGYGAFAVDGTADALAGLSAPDDTTVVVELDRPDVDLPALLAAPAFAIRPAATVAADAPALGPPAADGPAPVTSGPYRWESGDAEGAVLVRADGVDPEAARPERVELARTESVDAAVERWAGGEVDLVPLPAAGAGQTVPPGVGTVQFDALGALWWLGLNLDAPALADERVRQAVSLALDRPALVEVLEGTSGLDGLVAPQVPGGDVVCGDPCTRDVPAAEVLLAEASPDAPVALTLDVYDDPTVVAVAEAMAAQLAEAGVEVAVESRPFDAYRDGVLAADRQLFWFGWVGLAPTAGAYLEPTFRTDAPDNVVGLRDADVDAALAAAAATLDPEERAGLWGDAHALVLDRTVAVPIAQARAATAVAAPVQGYRLRLDATPVLADLWLAPDDPEP